MANRTCLFGSSSSRVDLRAPPDVQCCAANQKEGDIRAQFACPMQQIAAAEIEPEQSGQPQQSRRRIAAAATHTGAQRNGLFELCRQST